MRQWLALSFLILVAQANGEETLRNERYQLDLKSGGIVTVTVSGMPQQRLVPEFTVLESDSDPRLSRNIVPSTFPVAPRSALRWNAIDEPLASLNAWLASPAMKSAMGASAIVREDNPGQRIWDFRDASGKLKLSVTGTQARGTTRPFCAGRKTVLRAVGAAVNGNRIRWEFPQSPSFHFSAELSLPTGLAAPQISLELTPLRKGYYSVAFTGAPETPLDQLSKVPQECAGNRLRQFDFVLSEADLKLPRVQVSIAEGNMALVAEPSECRFRLPTVTDSRFGLMLAEDSGQLRPVLLAPLLGGAESLRDAGQAWRFQFRFVMRPGDWRDTFRHIAQDLHGFHDQRDASGSGSLNDCLEHVMDFLADRNGNNFAMWHEEQKYYDYFTDLTGVFKPFSPLAGLSAAVVTDDEDFYRRRARPAVEFALSRKSKVFTPYEAKHKIVPSAARELGGPYLGYAQLVSLYEFFQSRVPALKALADERGPVPNNLADALVHWQTSGDQASLDAAIKAAEAALKREPEGSVQALFDFAELYATRRDPRFLRGAIGAAYRYTTSLNLYPAPPEELVTVDPGGRAPVHAHSYGRHHNIWGFFPPEPVPSPEQRVPAWRVARLGTPSPAYPMEYWMNAHGALLRVAALAGDEFLHDVARWGMVGRFGNYPGDNRSQVSLIGELLGAVECPPWKWNFATVNPGHAWDFAGAVLDYLVSDAFYRSSGAIDFPGESLAGCPFRVRAYGAKPGRFYNANGVRLWMPRGLVRCNNRQIDWLSAYGDGQLFLALSNQSFHPEQTSVRLDPSRANCQEGDVRTWIGNRSATPLRISGNSFSLEIPPLGIAALAIPARVKPQFQAKLYSPGVPALGSGVERCETSFGTVHALLLSAGLGLTSAFVYTEAPPEQVIEARLFWRQGDGAWQEKVDAIYPYEFSPELADGGGDFECVLEVENAEQQIERSSVLRLALSQPAQARAASEAPPIRNRPPVVARDADPVPLLGWEFDTEFLSYLKSEANPKFYGHHDDGRFYPYSTPQGKRIGWRQPVWDKKLYITGCTPDEAEQQLRDGVARIMEELSASLATRTAPVLFARLGAEQKEILVDMALSEGVTGLSPELLTAVLARDWEIMARRHLYVRYDGPAPDHPRNKAFADRWIYSGRLGIAIPVSTREPNP